jgi:hypothetical protein
LYPTWLVRLFRTGSIHFERLVNPVPVVQGAIGQLRNDLLHYPFSHGLTHWLDRHNKYSDLEALEAVKAHGTGKFSLIEFFHSDPNQQRIALKNLFYCLPARPFIKFVYYFIIRRGFLDGSAGVTYCILQAFYEYMIVLKARELMRKGAGERISLEL